MIEMAIDSIGSSVLEIRGRVLLLKEKDGKRFLPISIGLVEAESIAFALEGESTPAPLTLDLILAIVEQYGGTISAAVITELRDDAFLAAVVLDRNGDRIEVRSRPSDAIALAVKADVPILAAEDVLAVAGIDLTLDQDAADQGRPSKLRSRTVGIFVIVLLVMATVSVLFWIGSEVGG